jgi:hypothetical protein
MVTCGNCQGEGSVTWEEDGRNVTDVCYHCAGGGSVDEETDHHDKLHCVATVLATMNEEEYRKAMQADPDGDGYDLDAYENGLMPHDYFRVRVWERVPSIAEALLRMSRQDQELMIAWGELPFTKWSMAHLPKVAGEVPIEEVPDTVREVDGDEIPF